MIRVAQLLLVLAAAGLWGASRLTWVVLETSDGLGLPRTATVNGATWSSTLIPTALLLLAAAAAALAVRGWPLRALAVLVALASAGQGYTALSLWVIPDVAAYAARQADIPVMDLVGSGREYAGAGVTAVAAAVTLVAAVLMIRSASNTRALRYRRGPAVEPADPGVAMSERMIWDALDEGSDPTRDPADPDNKGR